MPEPAFLGPRLACASVPALQNARAMTRARSHNDNAGDDYEAQLRPLWLRAQDGDEAAYRAALQRMAVRLRAYLRRRLQAWPDEVEDLVQETLLAIHLHRGTWEASLPVSAWMIAIARHKLIDLLRAKAARELLHDPLVESKPPEVGRDGPRAQVELGRGPSGRRGDRRGRRRDDRKQWGLVVLAPLEFDGRLFLGGSERFAEGRARLLRLVGVGRQDLGAGFGDRVPGARPIGET